MLHMSLTWNSSCRALREDAADLSAWANDVGEHGFCDAKLGGGARPDTASIVGASIRMSKAVAVERLYPLLEGQHALRPRARLFRVEARCVGYEHPPA